MGHIHLGTLPRTRLWKEVVFLLEDKASVGTVAAASAHAAEKSLLNASVDPVFVEAVRLLVSIPLAARQADFGDALRRLDLQIGSSPTLMDVVSAATRRLDVLAHNLSERSDFSDLSMRALSRAITNCVGDDLPGLFGASAEDVRLSFRKFSHGAGMATLCRAYFGTLVGSSLSYWLDRTLNSQIGAGQRFARVSDRAAFDPALRTYVSEATRIIKEFSAGFVGKASHLSGELNTADARAFGHVCLKKVVEELRAGRGQHA